MLQQKKELLGTWGPLVVALAAKLPKQRQFDLREGDSQKVQPMFYT